MSLKAKYFLFICTLHAALAVLVYFVLKENKLYFIASEIVLFISLYLSFLLYQAFIKPISLMQTGTDAIADADFSVKYLKTGSSEIDKLVDVFNAMIDQLREERVSLSEQSHFIQNLIQSTPLGIIILDYDGRITDINPAGRSILGARLGTKGQSMNSIDSPLVGKILQMNIADPRVISLNGIDKYKIQISEVIHQGFKRKFIIIDDLTSELLKSEKEAYGRIIRMMAHEVNNSMGAINSILDSVVEFGFEGDDNADLKDSLLLAKERNISLSQFMANFASVLRLPQPQLKKSDLHLFLKRIGQLHVPLAKEKNIEIKLEINLEECPVKMDLNLMEQAVSNIIKNSIEAIGQNGSIHILSNSDSSSRGFVIRDNGEGIPKGIETQIFTPFFSTKPQGQGVGLMLVSQILQDHNCRFSLHSDDEGWTRFTVSFP